MSESVEMYLVMTALLRQEPQQPVPLSVLAARLGVSQVSANEMCHRLSERGLISYQPYKGVTLTSSGELQAQEILSRRRLWVIFLVENLGIEPAEADDIACELEHITSERLVHALKAFVEHAPGAPGTAHDAEPVAGVPLSSCTAGTRGAITTLNLPAPAAAFVQGQGLLPGTEVELLAVANDGAVLLAFGQRQLALAAALATQVHLASAAEFTARHTTWARCSHFWECLRGQAVHDSTAPCSHLAPVN